MHNNKKIKVLIVDDSIFVRKTFETKLSLDQDLEVVGTAVDPFDAMEKIKQLKPDVLTVDVEMPKMNGIIFLKQLMQTKPIPVVVVSSLPINVLDALNAGAVDFVKKPDIRLPEDLNSFIVDLAAKIKIASVAHVGRTPVAPAVPSVLSKLTGATTNKVIAIGASTGGTEAILSIIKDLPVTTPGIVIVQHMPPVFTKMYAERIDKLVNMQVKEAANNDRVKPGIILIAAGDSHLTLCRDAMGYYVKSAPGPKVSGHCPSVDVLFDSVAATAGGNAIGIILTGMGSDGAKGLLKMRQAGAYTIGQNKESCVVYGMPMVAYNIGAVTNQFPLANINTEIIRYLNTK